MATRWCTGRGRARPASRRCCSTATTTCSRRIRWRNGPLAPFEPTERGDDLFGRGTSDDKGQTWILVKAVEQLMHLDGALPVNVKFLIEGEEESGGESIEKYVAEKPAELACDAVVICDTEMFAPGLPTLTTGLRGLVYGEIAVEGRAAGPALGLIRRRGAEPTDGDRGDFRRR